MALWSKKPSADAAEAPPAAAALPATAQAPAAIAANASAPAAVANAAPALAPEEMERRKQMSRHISATFGEIVSLLMRQPATKHHALADLEWLVLPPLIANQFSVAEAQSKSQGFMTPIAVVLWARVSAEVDQRLAESLDKPVRLTPAEWTSGDILWLIEASGEPRALQALLQRLGKGRWQGNNVKFRGRDKEGRVTVHTLATAPPAAPA